MNDKEIRYLSVEVLGLFCPYAVERWYIDDVAERLNIDRQTAFAVLNNLVSKGLLYCPDGWNYYLTENGKAKIIKGISKKDVKEDKKIKWDNVLKILKIISLISGIIYTVYLIVKQFFE